MSVYIYVITHKDTGRQYVGQSKSPRQRWGLHIGQARAGFNSPLHKAIRCFGPSSFELLVVQECADLNEALLAEAALIAKLHTYVGDGGLNGNRGESGPRRQKVGATATKRSSRESELRYLVLQQRMDRQRTRIHTNEAMKAVLGTGRTGSVPEWAVRRAKQACGLD